ncbi:CerR family C-terminal domain-containing protein [Rhodopseudomonas sp. HC1]|uniref:CerR family C-terminal domain-containing protein n=1 Tax=Rhodopseudomonas infernalis TaxID=2897386 RepID=UPI001EE86825|nr:CerR family C-terminal domain-containing protein [Rhodopseudomonas infernalis]MCG6204155.1 CerR family C-terminal domain-containing protein [Rhodopseudomonas infernalis]
MKSNVQAVRVQDAPPLAGHGHSPRAGTGAGTRAKMIQAAIEVFGSIGFDGATTRQLAERAGVNQAAIPYHFGGKRELYLAAAQTIADSMRCRIEPLIDELRTPSADPVGHIGAVVMRFFELIAGNDQPEAWTAFFARCERDTDDAFRILHDQSVARFQAALITQVAAATGRSPNDEDLKIRVAIVLGAISNFRTLRDGMLRSLGWDTFDAGRKRTMETIVRRLVLAELLGIRSGATSAPRSANDIQTITFGPATTRREDCLEPMG